MLLWISFFIPSLSCANLRHAQSFFSPVQQNNYRSQVSNQQFSLNQWMASIEVIHVYSMGECHGCTGIISVSGIILRVIVWENRAGSKDGGRPISSKLIPFDRHQIEIRLVKYERLGAFSLRVDHPPQFWPRESLCTVRIESPLWELIKLATEDNHTFYYFSSIFQAFS